MTFLYLLFCLTSAGGSNLPSVQIFLVGLRIVDISVFSAFYLLGESGSFQASYMWKQKKKKESLISS